MKKRYPHKDNVLLVNITRLGDMLQATPTIAGLKEENPNCRITVIVEKQFAGICEVIPYIDEIVGLDLGMTVRALTREGEGIVEAYEYISSVVEDLRSRNFDYVVNMSSSAYTALLLNLIGIERRGGWSADEEGYRVIESEWARLFASSVFHMNRLYNSLNLVDIFRCSADVELHPNTLVVDVDDDSIQYCKELIDGFGFTNTGPIVCVQAGASQAKRQWAPERFSRFVDIMTRDHNARVILSGSKKELTVINSVIAGCTAGNVGVAAGQTNIPQLAALLKLSDILVTGDTGPMHLSVATGTPVVSMFLASAFGFETGPYSTGNIVLQPVIECGPCNPNKGCSRPDCHDLITPETLAELTAMRLKEDFTELPPDLADAMKLIVYRTCFDEYGFYDMKPLNTMPDRMAKFRDAYRKMWLDDLAGLGSQGANGSNGNSALGIVDPGLQALGEVEQMADNGAKLIEQLVTAISDTSIPGERFREINDRLTDLDLSIERTGYHHPELGLITRMFVFAKENLSGTEAGDLASQMSGVYTDLRRRSRKLAQYYQSVS